MERGIASYHPIVSLTYFLVVVISSMIFMHPILSLISFISSCVYAFLIDSDKFKKCLKYAVLMSILIVLANILFVHRGATVITYFRGNPLTLESMIYGIVSGVNMASVVIWFFCYNEVITSEKFLYIFAKTVPTAALIVSMTIRLIPKLVRQSQIITHAQKSMGLDIEEGSIRHRLKSGMRILSVLVTWALEDAVETADSMKARGYGVKGRTSFSIYTFIDRDMIMLALIGISSMFIIAGYFSGYCSLRFYPVVGNISYDVLSLMIYGVYSAVCFTAVLSEIVESVRWRYLG